MQIEPSEKWLPIYEALASEVRLKIIHLLADKQMNIKELAAAIGLSSAILSMHIKKLEKSGIIETQMSRINGGTQKLCKLVMETLEITFPNAAQTQRKSHEISIPVGHYTDFQVEPTCGLATVEHLIGYFDDPRYFLDPERVNAKVLWFGEGFVEYKIPNHLLHSETPKELEILLELGSEAEGSNENWPSDISFFLNGHALGYWTSPGDYGSKRGKYTPSWWELGVNQFGLLKTIRINETGTYIDGQKLSDQTIYDYNIENTQWIFRLAVLPDAVHKGGLTLYGKGFGNYNQDMLFRLYYK
ncbi:MAG: ArsR family transcriptional regulator [Paenibacillaceae bacterium]